MSDTQQQDVDVWLETLIDQGQSDAMVAALQQMQAQKAPETPILLRLQAHILYLANDFERARDWVLTDADYVAHPQQFRRLGRGVVEADLAAAAGFRRLGARLEQAHGEQPFVHPHFLRLVHRG